MEIRTSQRLFITGRTRSGKSVFAKSLLGLYPRVCIHDRKWEHNSLTSAGYIIVNNLKGLVKALKDGKKRVLYQPADPSAEDFDVFCNVLYALGNICVVIDEAQSLTSASKIPYWYSEILRLGAIRNVGVISITQRPKGIANVIISEAEYVVAFRLSLEDDRKKVISTIGKVCTLPNGKTKSTDDVLRTLEPYHFVLFDGDKPTICSPIKFDGK